MFKLNPRIVTVMVAFMFTIFVFSSAIVAQKTVDSSVIIERERFSRVMHSGGNIEEFRHEYYNYLSELENTLRLFNEVPAVRDKFNRSGLRPLERLAEAKGQVGEASTEELILMRSIYAKVPSWREAPKSLESLLKPNFRKQLQARLNSKENGQVILKGVADDCAFAIQQDHTNKDISIARGVSLGLAAVMEGFPTDGLTVAARIAPIAAWAAAEASVIGIETLKATKDDCQANEFETGITQQITDTKNTIVNNDNTNKNTILSNIETAKTAIINNDDSNKDTIITNDNSNKTAIINNDNANKDTIVKAVNDAKTQIIVNANANKDELLRLHIHADLASVDNATPVAVFMLPAVKGGYLELVRTIVVKMIADLAGSSTAQANAFLSQGDAQKNAGNYKSAYDLYRKAYKVAAK